MRFQFDVALTENDYLDYNMFHAFKSPYGVFALKKFRRALTFFFASLIFAILVWKRFSFDGIVLAAVQAVIYAVIQIFLKRWLIFGTKINIKQLKKSGKMAYSPISHIEFFDEFFIETTEVNKVEQKYSSIERISIIAYKCIYLHVNNVAAYIIPNAAFASEAQYNEFCGFLSTICPQITVYNEDK